MARHYAWGDYFWPHTTVLANKLGIVDAEELREVEHELTADRQEQIERGEVVIARTFDNAHLCAAHVHLFGEVYDWAGQWRTVDMVKGESTFAAVPWGIEARLAEAAQVAAGTDWAHVDREGFAQAMGAFYAEINHAHSFVRATAGPASWCWISSLSGARSGWTGTGSAEGSGTRPAHGRTPRRSPGAHLIGRRWWRCSAA